MQQPLPTVAPVLATLTLTGPERWQVHHRLQELDIPCTCAPGRPLRMQIATPQAALLAWSAIRAATQNRSDHLGWLNRCWNASNP
ncbi:MAG: hypothetical protein IGQ88_10720 [Gloeomargaritaceae cyanobacterium C42_A2020_066]|nr:hypothetical protein [Gloeomargaritaceae cyanobacterium C42_A2020_066]